MKFKVIMDDYKLTERFETGWGISVYFPDFMLLFGTGENYITLEENLEIAGIEEDDIKHIFIPIESWEHTGGLESVMGVNKSVYVPSGASDDLIEMIESVGSRCHIIKSLQEVIPSVYSTGNISEVTSEQALIIESGFSISVFTGSSEGNILNILKVASKVSNSVDLLFGRLNPLSYGDLELKNLAEEINIYKPRRIAPVHLSGMKALKVFKDYFGDKFIKVGIGLEGEV